MQEGKNIVDIVQILLQQESWIAWLSCILLIVILLQFFKILGAVWRGSWAVFQQIKKLLFRFSIRNVIIVVCLGTLLWLMSDWVGDWLQDLEQRYFHPVFVGQYDSLNEAHLISFYEAELAHNTDPYIAERIKKRTQEMAIKIQSTPLAIYECAYLECSLQPFTIRTDRVAAGWIQFTRTGLGGLRYKGQKVDFEQVIQACQQRDIEFIMDLTEIYLEDKYKRAGQRPLNNTIDLYLALFAPALIGAPHDKVVYEGWKNPSYFLNSGLDGWYATQTDGGQQQIFRKRTACDGRITIWEMYLALESRKNRVVSKYLK